MTRWRALSAVQRLLAGYVVLYVLWYFASGTTGQPRRFISDAASIPVSIAGLVLSLAAARDSRRQRDRYVWLFISLALICEVWGDGFWWWLEGVRGVSPFPSVADIGYVAFYPALTAALLAIPVQPQSRRAAVGNLLDVLALVGGAFMAMWYLVLGAALQGEGNGLGRTLSVSYPMLDLLLVLSCGRILLRGIDPHWSIRARWLTAGSLAFVVADVGFGVLSNLAGVPGGGGWLDLVWLAALTCFALAAASRPAASAAPESSLARHVHLLPVLAIAASYAVVAKVAWRLPLVPVGGVLLVDLLLTVVVVARQFVAVAESRELAARYRATAATDVLTGVASRGRFLERADGMLTGYGGDRCALAMIDVDHFKAVNDIHGHLAGDAALQLVAAHLQGILRECDLLARFGGDEFVALLGNVSRVQAAAVVARLTDARTLRIGGQQLSLSVGWASGSTDVVALLGRADQALYAAKAAGRGRPMAAHDLEHPAGTARADRVHRAAIDTRGALLTASDGPAMERSARELREALSKDQLTLHYQPKLDPAKGTVCGVEGLVRWCHPTQGLRYPDSFLPQVHELGLMAALTDRVLAMALDQLLAWREEGLAPMTVAINLAASSVVDVGLPGRVCSALSARGLSGNVLIVEITEQCLIADRIGAGQVLAALREQGVRVSLDDFGTGYSSLAYLRDLPIDELKLDRAFIAPLVDDARAAALVQSTIMLSHALGLPMVAEGVEDPTTCEQLTAYGCDLVQGYHLARPMPGGQLAHWLAERQNSPRPVG